MRKIFKAKTFYITLIFSIAFIFIALINFNRVYISESSVLIVIKGEKNSATSEQIIENLRILPTTLSFYKQINDKENINEEIVDLPDQKIKKIWNSKLKVERLGKSGILKISNFAEDMYQAEIMHDTIIKTLISSIGFYYDIENDIDLRIIEGPITKESNGKSIWFLFFLSFASGFVLTILSFTFSFSLFEKNREMKKIKLNISNFKKDFYNKKEKIKDLNTLILQEEEKPIDFLKKPEIYSAKRAVAPDNLPVASEEILTEEIKEEIKEESESTQPIIREATPEEVKERLNKLLSGKM